MNSLFSFHFLKDSITEEEFITVDRVMLAPLPLDSTIPHDEPVQSETMQPSQTAVKKYTPASHFSDLDRDMILSDISSEPHSVISVAKQNDVSPTNIHYWAKKEGMEMPSKKLKRDIVEDCVTGTASPAVLAKAHGRNARTIRSWVKKSGEKLPGKYTATAATHPSSTVIYKALLINRVKNFLS